MNKNTQKPTFKCCFCKRTFDGYGNNPKPALFHGRCCDKCNKRVVIPFRLLLLTKIQNQDDNTK